MSVIKITHGERRTNDSLAVREMTGTLDPIVCWVAPGGDVELDLKPGVILTLSLESMEALKEEPEFLGEEVAKVNAGMAEGGELNPLYDPLSDAEIDTAQNGEDIGAIVDSVLGGVLDEPETSPENLTKIVERS